MLTITMASAAEMQHTKMKMLIHCEQMLSGILCIKGLMQGKEMLLIKTGVGAKRAGAAARQIIKHSAPAFVLALGAAGAADASLKVGDIVVIKRNMQRSGLHVAGDDAFSLKAFHALKKAGLPVIFGDCVTLNRFIHLQAEKKNIFETSSAHVIDMESAAIAQVLCAKGIPFLNIRVVSDTAGEDTVDLESLFKNRKGPGSAAAGLYFLKKPSELLRAFKLKKNVRKVSVVISEIVEILVKEPFLNSTYRTD
ncbi:MAG: hypothetical protein WCQ99_11305 [Pseudomonadota bacterium]